MNDASASAQSGDGLVGTAIAQPRSRMQRLENWWLTVPLLAMVALPLADRVTMRLGAGFASASALTAHLALLLTMLGGVAAAGSNRLIASPLLLDRLPARSRAALADLGRAAGVVISLQLARAGWTFVTSDRTSDVDLLPGLPLWFVEVIIPAGFLLLALRLWWSGAPSRYARATTGLLALSGLALCAMHWPPATGVGWGLAALAVALLAGAPMYTVIGGLGMLLMWGAGQQPAAMAVKHYALATTPVIPTLPLFAFTGYLLAESGAARRLVHLFATCFGPFRGGLAVATVLACAFFTTFTGASGVTILALGGLLLPVLTGAGYRERDALGLITGSGAIGMLFPPCLPVILYSIVALQTLQGLEPAALDRFDLSIEGMFKAAFLPGVVLVVATMLWGRSREPRRTADRHRFNRSAALHALWAAKWELALPVVAVGALFGGWVNSPVQAAALTAAYALLVEAFIHRDLALRVDLPRIGAECAVLTGGILLILGTAMGLTNYLITEQVPDQLTYWMGNYVESKTVFLLLLNLGLLAVGCLMDVYSAIVVVVPLVVPLGMQYGVDPVHLGVIFLINLELGFLHPPVGINLFLASYRFNRPLGEIVWAVLPMLAVVGAVVLLVTFWPPLTHWLPTAMGR